MADSSPGARSRVFATGEFEELYRKHLDAVFRYALRTIGRRDVAEDVTADAFLELCRHADRVKAEELPAWLLTVVRNRAIDYWRHQAVERRYVNTMRSSAEPQSLPDEGGLFESKVLKPVHRLCLILRYAYGMDRAEIARYTGLSSDRVKGYLQYARHLLRTELLERSGEGR